MDKYRVVIVDDVRIYAQALEESLMGATDIEVVGLAYGGREAMALVERTQPDVVLMDLDMPDMDGLTVTRCIKEQALPTEVIVLTVFDDAPHLFQALQVGAKGYLLKNAEPEDVAQAVRDVAHGGGVLPPALAVTVMAEFQRLGGQAARRDELYRKLTRQETEVLRRLVLRMTNEQIGRDLFLELSTVKKHVGNILKKLEVNNRQEAAQIAQFVGL